MISNRKRWCEPTHATFFITLVFFVAVFIEFNGIELTRPSFQIKTFYVCWPNVIECCPFASFCPFECLFILTLMFSRTKYATSY